MNEPYPGTGAPGDEAPVADRPRGARDQGGAAPRRRWRRRTWAFAACTTVAVVAAVGGVTAALLTASASDAPSALASVNSAIAKTSADSYGFSLDSTVRIAGREWRSDVVSGAFDPRHGLGAESLTVHGPRSEAAKVRFVGGYVYTWIAPGSGFGTIGKPWNKAPIPPASADGMSADDPYGFVSDAPVSPAELVVVLRSAGTLRDAGAASGTGWTGTGYTFTASFLGGQESVTGTVYVDQQGQVRRLVTVTTQKGVTTSRDLTFGDFGAPVRVSAPAAAQVKYTRTPWWGFLF
jgi:hypothetical protein